ncbi:hypothetical protein PPERSA_03988 [Pseudocohnilembus persalinus]|uniref:Uncharacterized protein n=1 Tax=Pseudocohnilembus persalinus TaxID=266149 RepID=A0A0V0QBC1_PSEPJ|nr:hypothetical protein PPERSA_03988 [Pseudocohnilembus persalinus]|eukprot:KRW99518.1 hypothetical protein PPERSA_03988 [Pseudocohnilembus persalinus]
MDEQISNQNQIDEEKNQEIKQLDQFYQYKDQIQNFPNNESIHQQLDSDFNELFQNKQENIQEQNQVDQNEQSQQTKPIRKRARKSAYKADDLQKKYNEQHKSALKEKKMLEEKQIQQKIRQNIQFQQENDYQQQEQSASNQKLKQLDIMQENLNNISDDDRQKKNQQQLQQQQIITQEKKQYLQIEQQQKQQQQQQQEQQQQQQQQTQVKQFEFFVKQEILPNENKPNFMRQNVQLTQEENSNSNYQYTDDSQSENQEKSQQQEEIKSQQIINQDSDINDNNSNNLNNSGFSQKDKLQQKDQKIDQQKKNINTEHIQNNFKYNNSDDKIQDSISYKQKQMEYEIDQYSRILTKSLIIQDINSSLFNDFDSENKDVAKNQEKQVNFLDSLGLDIIEGKNFKQQEQSKQYVQKQKQNLNKDDVNWNFLLDQTEFHDQNGKYQPKEYNLQICKSYDKNEMNRNNKKDEDEAKKINKSEQSYKNQKDKESKNVSYVDNCKIDSIGQLKKQNIQIQTNSDGQKEKSQNSKLNTKQHKNLDSKLNLQKQKNSKSQNQSTEMVNEKKDKFNKFQINSLSKKQDKQLLNKNQSDFVLFQTNQKLDIKNIGNVQKIKKINQQNQQQQKQQQQQDSIQDDNDPFKNLEQLLNTV